MHQPDRSFESELANAANESQPSDDINAGAMDADSSGSGAGAFSGALEDESNRSASTAAPSENPNTGAIKNSAGGQHARPPATVEFTAPAAAEIKTNQGTSAKPSAGKAPAAKQQAQPHTDMVASNGVLSTRNTAVSTVRDCASGNGFAAANSLVAAGQKGAQCGDPLLEPAGSVSKSGASNAQGIDGGIVRQPVTAQADQNCSAPELPAAQLADATADPKQISCALPEMGAQFLQEAPQSATNSQASANIEGGALKPGKASTQFSLNLNGSENSTASNVSTSGGTSGITTAARGGPGAGGQSTAAKAQGAQEPQTVQIQTASAVEGTSGTHAAQNPASGLGPASIEATVTHPAGGNTGADQSTQARETHTGMASDGAEMQPASPISTAKLMQTVGQAEMRVGIQSGDFGSISIRTSLSQDGLHAQISLPHEDMSHAILAQVPTLETKLGEEHGMRALIEVNNQGFAWGGGSEQSSQRENSSPGNLTPWQANEPSTDSSPETGLGPILSAANAHMLDIVA